MPGQPRKKKTTTSTPTAAGAEPLSAARSRVRRALAEEDEGYAPRPTRSRTDGPRVRTIHLGAGLPSLPEVLAELYDMTDVLMGRKDTPQGFGVLTLHEVADAYFARASELTMLIQTGEANGSIPKGSGLYKLRTGELRTFLEMSKRASDLGSRRLTAEGLQIEKARRGVDSAGG